MKCTVTYLRSIVLWLVCMTPLWAFSQNITVTGTVQDEAGDPLIGATVQQKGSGNGIATDVDGHFKLSLPKNATLVVSYVGYTTQTVAVDGRTNLTIVLKEDSEVLDEVVVVGYGQMKRSDLTGSVTSVGEDAVKKSIATSVDQVLQGRAAGVQIQANSGTPGASTSIRIRGINPLSSINPSDIVSMDILKDASATAIYGSRASNGVIMITTKRGKAGEATVTYDMYLGWQEMPKKYDLLNLREYAEHHNYRAEYISSVDQSAAFIRPDLLGKGTDWQDELFRKAFMMNHSISVSGGNDRTTYAFSGGYLDQEGIAHGSSFQRFSLRSNLDTQIKSWLRGGVNFSFTDSKQVVGTDNNTIISALIQ